MEQKNSPPLDAGIARDVEILRAAGIETFAPYEGGTGHTYPEPTVRFHGGKSEGFECPGARPSSELIAPRQSSTVSRPALGGR